MEDLFVHSNDSVEVGVLRSCFATLDCSVTGPVASSVQARAYIYANLHGNFCSSTLDRLCSLCTFLQLEALFTGKNSSSQELGHHSQVVCSMRRAHPSQLQRHYRPDTGVATIPPGHPGIYRSAGMLGLFPASPGE